MCDKMAISAYVTRRGGGGGGLFGFSSATPRVISRGC